MVGNTQVINLTPHPINIIGLDEETRTFAPSGFNVRINTSSGGHTATLGDVEIPMFASDTTGDVVIFDNATKEVVCDFSDVEANTDRVFIVSGMVGAVLKHRPDIFVPMTAPSDKPVRNDKGHIVAVRGIKTP
jgi:hypothetical protein